MTPMPGFLQHIDFDDALPTVEAACPACRTAGEHPVAGCAGEGGSRPMRLCTCAACGQLFLAGPVASDKAPAGWASVAPADAVAMLDEVEDPRDYAAWVARFDRLDAEERARIARLAAGPGLPRVRACVFDETGWRRPEGRPDVTDQILPVEAWFPGGPCAGPTDGLADDDLVLFLHDGARLRPHAAFLVADAARLRPDGVLFYGDEDRLEGTMRVDPFFKPSFSRDLFAGLDFLSAVCAVRVRALRLPDARLAPPAVAERVALEAPPDGIVHIPHILHHGVQPEALARRRPLPGATPAAADPGTVSVLIPTHAQETLLRACVESLYRLNPATAIDLILVDNSRSPDYRRMLETLCEGRSAQILDWPEPFNFARMMNAAAARAVGRCLCFLNDDTEGLTPGWLAAMARQALRPDIGTVGARLLYSDGSVQHGGVVLTGGSGAAHLHHRVPMGSDGHGGLAGLRQEVSAVTAACMVVETAKFQAAGGFDEAAFAVNFNDVDLCLRLAEGGLASLYLPEATLHHHESVSRRRSADRRTRIDGQRELHRLTSRWRLAERPDRFHNPNLSLALLDGGLAFPPRTAAPWRADGFSGRPPASVSESSGGEGAGEGSWRHRQRLETARRHFQDDRPADAARAGLAVLADPRAPRPMMAAAAGVVALCAERGGARNVAERFLRRAVQLDPERVEHRHTLGNLLARGGRLEAAAAAYEAVVAQDPDFVESLRSLATVSEALGREGRAVEALSAACLRVPDRGELWAALLDTAWRTGHLSHVLAAVNRVEPTRGLAFAHALFQALGARHRVKLVAREAKSRGIDLTAANAPTAAEVARHRRFLTAGDPKDEPEDGWVRIADERLRRRAGRVDRDAAAAIRFSVIMPVYEPALADLARAIDSLLRQSHAGWELCIADDASANPRVSAFLSARAADDPRIRVTRRAARGHISAASNTALAMAGGEYLVLLDQDDELDADALLLVADAILSAGPGAPDLVFSDEDRIAAAGRRFGPHFKKGWDPVLMLHQNAVSHLGVFRREAVVAIGGFREGLEGAQDHDLVLRLMRWRRPDGTPPRILHVPGALYHWRVGEHSTASSVAAKPYALTAGCRAVQDHLDATSPGARVLPIASVAGYRVLWPRPPAQVTVSVILGEAVELMAARTIRSSLTAIGDTRTAEILFCTPDGAAVRIAADGREETAGPAGGPDGARTPPAIRRRLATLATGTFVLFCHPMVRFDRGGWLEELTAFAWSHRGGSRRADDGGTAGPGVDAVGPKLVDGAGSTISCGLLPDRRVIAWRLGWGASALAPGYFGRLAFSHEEALLDELCLLVRRDAIAGTGWLNGASGYRMSLDLLDLLLRLEAAGGRCAVVPDAVVSLDAPAAFNAALLAHSDPQDVWTFLSRWSGRLDPEARHNPNLVTGADCYRPRGPGGEPAPGAICRSDGSLPVAYKIDAFWCDRHGMYFEGWVHCHQHRVTGLRIRVGEDAYEVPSFRRRDDLLAFHPEHPHVAEGGFVGYVQCRPGQPVSLEVTSEGGSRSVPVDLPKGSLLKEPWTEFQRDIADASIHTLKRFIAEVNERRLTVAEIGSRHVGEASENMRSYFQGAGRYIGIDIHAAPGVDVVGDAHALDRLVGRGCIDAVFSLSVIEHLAYPWVLAAATNRALAMGGLVFHSAPQTYPLHEQPNDFWRYSDEALKVLFGPQTGFEVIAAGMVNAMHMHPEERRGVFATIPLNPGYGNAFILARKVRDLPDGAVAWPIDDNQSHDRAKLYPQRPSTGQ
ncbi:glycosyltransferase [Azospirillum formosense]|uniref:glycosyltransferase n=1 Tax=Azospirillum formosense TaxID=861533 RepID=UPI00338FBC4A